MANAAAHTGYLRGDVTCYALLHGSDQPCEMAGHSCPLVEIKSTKEPVVLEHIHLNRSGQTQHVEVHGFPIFDESGEVVQIIEYSLDITERKLIEIALAENQANLLALIENTSDRIWAIDKHYGLIECNAAFRQYLSDTYGVEFQTGDSIFMDGIPASVQSDFKSLYDRCLAGEKFSFERWTSDSTQKRCRLRIKTNNIMKRN